MKSETIEGRLRNEDSKFAKLKSFLAVLAKRITAQDNMISVLKTQVSSQENRITNAASETSRQAALEARIRVLELAADRTQPSKVAPDSSDRLIHGLLP